MSPTTLAAALSAGLLFSLTGCVPTSDDPLACKDNGSCDHQEERTFCDIDRAYPDTIQPNECIVPPSADACNRVAACDDPAKPHCTDDSMGTCVECTDNTHCTVDGESCNTNTGECGDFTPCTPGDAGDAECAANGDGLDFCSDGGLCAECIDDTHCTGFANEGTCDTVALECRACEVGGSDCESGLCGTRDDGECVPVADVIRVDGANTGGDVAGCGAVGSECATIKHAVDTEVGGMRNIIVVADGEYPQALNIAAGSVTIIGERDAIVNPSLDAGTPLALSVSGGASAVIKGISIAPASGTDGTDAVSCSGAGSSLTLDSVAVSNATDLGVIGDNCDLTVTRSTISGNRGGGIDVSGGDFNITNNFIVYNGSILTTAPGVNLEGNAGTKVFDFNTVVGNLVGNGTATTGVVCGTLASFEASSNIVYTGNPGANPPVSGNCTWAYSNIQADIPGTENINQPPMLVNNSALDGDYHLASGSPCINKGAPSATLATDIDGEERPLGGRHDIGADEAE